MQEQSSNRWWGESGRGHQYVTWQCRGKLCEGLERRESHKMKHLLYLHTSKILHTSMQKDHNTDRHMHIQLDSLFTPVQAAIVSMLFAAYC